MGSCFSVGNGSFVSKSQQTLLQRDLNVVIAGYIRHIHIHINAFSHDLSELSEIERIILMFYYSRDQWLPPPIKTLETRLQSYTQSSEHCSNSQLLSTRLSPKTPITPANPLKKKPTQQELQMVLDHFHIAQNKNMEQILSKHEPHVLQFRDQIYSEAKQNQINCKSNETERLKVLGKVVEYTYMNIEPPNEYTKKTDRKHFKEVAALASRFCKKQNMKVPLTLICAAWCHDIERFIPSIKCKYLPESVDKYRKQAIHPITSAKIARLLFNGGPITSEEMDRIYELILRHDLPNPKIDIIILNELLIKKVNDDLLWELECLMDGDAFAFFETTIKIFINYKSNSNSPEWIWERVSSNIRKLRKNIRPKAAECIHDLSEDLLCKMRVDWDELNRLCF